MDLVRLALLVVGLFVIYNLFFAVAAPVKNIGSVTMDTVGVPVHMTESEQIENAPQGTLATGENPYAGEQAPVPHSSKSSSDNSFLQNNENVLPYPQISNNYVPQTGLTQQMVTSCNPNDPDYFNSQVLTASDLLPRDNGFNGWNDSNPQAQGHLSDQNFLASGHHFGINTVGQSLKNANKSLRSDPPIPQVAVGPWLQSTIEADTNRKQFEIGSC